MGWQTVETGRCSKCSVFTEKSELLFGKNGLAYCTSCGVPPSANTASVNAPVSEPPRAGRWDAWTKSWWTARSLRSEARTFFRPRPVANPYAAAVMAMPPMYRNVIQHHVRYIIGAILLVTLSFPIAACVSQL